MDTLVIKRNEVNLPFTPETVMRGDKKGTTYLCPEITEENLPEAIKFLSPEYVASVLSAKVKQTCQGWMDEATSDDGVFNESEFVQFVQGMSARGESIPVLKNRIMELVDKIGNTNDTDAVVKIAAQIKSLKAAIESKRRKTPEDEVEAATIN